MKNLIKIAVLLLVAMFTFNTAAEAQFGLINKALSAPSKKKAKNEKERVMNEAHEKFAAQQEQMKLAIPQPDAEGKERLFSIDGKGICSWNSATLELTILTDRAGNTPGSVYKLDPATGKFTDKNGASKGSINADGTIESPNLGTLKLIVKIEDAFINYNDLVPNHGIIGLTDFRAQRIDSYTVRGTINGKADSKIGKVVNNRAYSSDYIGNVVVQGAVNPLLMAYVAYGIMLSEQGLAAGFAGFDPETKYTVAQLEDMVQWNNDAAKRKLMEYETSYPYAGFDRVTHPEFKNVKIGAIGLMSEWKETKEDRTAYYQGTIKWYTSISYWVIYEFEDGRNIMGRNMYSDVWSEGNSNVERKNFGFYEVTDWVRK
ncbi:MAG: hypothetical protein IJ933_02800 [Bacteroidales bacterium]|nr:hypothetical protein [Bacteroidales bacterium]